MYVCTLLYLLIFLLLEANLIDTINDGAGDDNDYLILFIILFAISATINILIGIITLTCCLRRICKK